MENPSPSLLILHGKSSLETEFAQSLITNNTLKLSEDDGGEEVSIFLQSHRHEEPTTFQVEWYMNSLLTKQFGRLLLWSPRLSSTQDLISKNFSEIPVGSVCVADVQFKGRGRSKNLWESPKGCLLFSFTLQMEDGRIVPLLQYVVCLAITEAIKDICDAQGFPYIGVRIKWPNDLYLNGVKVGGILCTSTYRSKKFNVTVGMGLNVDNELPTTCLNKVLNELSASTDCKLRREEILAAFFNRFEDFYGVFVSQGFRALEEMYYRAWLHSEQKVVIQEKNKDELVEEIGVTIQGLTSSGYLLAIDDDNQLYELHPDGNSFDFFNGLVRKKLE
ncbi:Biotin--protein ligase [Thalictrum thalictroides]|uniref:Biotin--protein ligase n=1 Tax=Thalictrum thalictroides TaxID=46969 RepID=A0A7J6W944_THATH|nr:Biotin--protein ligase [Thalictrum thalictroides]